MKYALVLTLVLLTACTGTTRDNGKDMEIRRAQPGVVDHNVIPKR